jgi:hypothetical protein
MMIITCNFVCFFFLSLLSFAFGFLLKKKRRITLRLLFLYVHFPQHFERLSVNTVLFFSHFNSFFDFSSPSPQVYKMKVSHCAHDRLTGICVCVCVNPVWDI